MTLNIWQSIVIVLTVYLASLTTFGIVHFLMDFVVVTYDNYRLKQAIKKMDTAEIKKTLDKHAKKLLKTIEKDNETK